MKTLVRAPLEVPFNVPQLLCTFNVWVWRVIALACFAATLLALRGGVIGDSAALIAVTLFAVWQGLCFSGIGLHMREMCDRQADTLQRLTEHEEHIRKLEARLADLTPPSTTP